MLELGAPLPGLVESNAIAFATFMFQPGPNRKIGTDGGSHVVYLYHPQMQFQPQVSTSLVAIPPQWFMLTSTCASHALLHIITGS